MLVRPFRADEPIAIEMLRCRRTAGLCQQFSVRPPDHADAFRSAWPSVSTRATPAKHRGGHSASHSALAYHERTYIVSEKDRISDK